MAESDDAEGRAGMNARETGQGTSMEDLVRASLDAQGVIRSETRISEIAAEAERLTRAVSAHVGRLSYYDEPSHFAALLLEERADG